MTTTKDNLPEEQEEVQLNGVDTRGLHPDRPLSNRHREVARLYALGNTPKYIAERLEYTVVSIYRILKEPKIKAEIERYRDRLFQADQDNRMKDVLPDAFDVIEQLLRSDKVDLEKKEQAAKWVIEKMTGKPAQQIDAKVEVSLGAVFEKLDNLKVVQATRATALPEGEGEIIDIQPEEEPETIQLDSFDDWLDHNM